MRVGWAALAIATLGFGVAVAGQQATTVPQDARSIVEARRAAYMMSGANMAAMKRAIDAGEDVRPLTFAARSLAGWALALPGMFPKGSDVAPSVALPAVWSDRAGFEAKAADYAAAADRLAKLAAANDKQGFAEQWAVVRKSCADCHAGYKKEN